MPLLVLVNGAPGSGKSTVASALVGRRPMALALDIDALKHNLGAWDADAHASGLQARRLAIALIERHLDDGHDVVLGQYLARTAFIEELERVASAHGARFVEVVMVLDAVSLAARLAARSAEPDRAEHAVNNSLVRPDHANVLVASIEVMLQQRTFAIRIDASGSLEQTLARVRRAAFGS